MVLVNTNRHHGEQGGELNNCIILYQTLFFRRPNIKRKNSGLATQDSSGVGNLLFMLSNAITQYYQLIGMHTETLGEFYNLCIMLFGITWYFVGSGKTINESTTH